MVNLDKINLTYLYICIGIIPVLIIIFLIIITNINNRLKDNTNSVTRIQNDVANQSNALKNYKTSTDDAISKIATGITGPQGNTGPQGPPGQPGATGPIGPQGPAVSIPDSVGKLVPFTYAQMVSYKVGNWSVLFDYSSFKYVSGVCYMFIGDANNSYNYTKTITFGFDTNSSAGGKARIFLFNSNIDGVTGYKFTQTDQLNLNNYVILSNGNENNVKQLRVLNNINDTAVLNYFYYIVYNGY